MHTEELGINWDTLERRSYGVPILELLVSQKEQLTFGSIMNKLGISKRGLSLTLSDLENDGLISRSKSGRSTFVSITEKGKQALLLKITKKKDTESLIERTVRETVEQLEKEGIIKKEWSDHDRQEFIQKLQKIIRHQLRGSSQSNED